MANQLAEDGYKQKLSRLIFMKLKLKIQNILHSFIVINTRAKHKRKYCEIQKTYDG